MTYRLTPFTRSRLMMAAAPVILASGPSVFAQSLTLVSFNNGGGYTLGAAANNSSAGALTSNELLDVNHVSAVGATTTSTIYSLAVQTGGNTTVNVGAIAFDYATAGKSIQFDANSSTLGTTMGTLAIAGGSIAMNTALSGTGTVTTGDLIDVSSTVAGYVTFGPSNYGTLAVSLPSAGGNFDVAGGSTLLFGSYAPLYGSGSININGAGTVALTGANSAGFTGGFNLSNGVLSITTSTYALGASGATTTMNGGTLQFNSNVLLGLSRPFQLNATSSGGFSVPGTGSVLLEGTIGGVGALVKWGTGTLALNSTGNLANYSPTYTGGVVVNQGTVTFMARSDLGTSVGTQIINGGALVYAGTATSSPETARYFQVNSANSIIGVNTATLSIFGSVTGTGSLTKTGAGTLILNGTSTFAGSTTVAGGVLVQDGATQLGALPTTPTDNIFLSGGEIDFTANATTVPLNVNRNVVLGTSTAGGVGTIGVSTTHTFDIAGPLIEHAASGSLVKVDTGTLILSNASSNYTGGTTVLGGELLVNNTSGSATGTGSISIGGASAGSFGGNGFVTGDIVANTGGNVIPGTFGGTSIATYTPGTITTSGNLTLHSGSGVSLKIASSSSYDSIALTGGAGSVNFDSGTNTVDLSLVSLGSTAVAGDRYNLITFPLGTVVTNFTATTPSQPGTFVIDPSSLTAFDTSNASINYDPSFGDIYISGVVALPEPTTLSIAAAAAGSLLLRRRRRGLVPVNLL